MEDDRELIHCLPVLLRPRFSKQAATPFLIPFAVSFNSRPIPQQQITVIDMSWNEIVGHRTQQDLLRGTIIRQRLAHTYLFVGMDGVGKQTFAFKVAQCLLCQRRTEDEFEACGTCPGCKPGTGCVCSGTCVKSEHARPTNALECIVWCQSQPLSDRVCLDLCTNRFPD